MDTLGLLLIAGLALYWFAPNVFADILPGSSAAGLQPGYSGGWLTAPQIGQLAASAGFSGPDLITAVAVALAESSGNPNALGDGGASYGLWQINVQYHPEFGPNFQALYDPATNAQAAYSVYSAAGRSFKPWTTFTSGAYAKFVSQVQQALA